MRRSSIAGDGDARLGEIPLFAGLSEGQLRMLGRLVDEVTAAPGETVMEQGAPGYEFMMLEQGSAAVVQDGRQIRTMGPGDFFGELAVIGDGAQRSASVVALSELRGLVFTAHFLREMRERLPALGDRIDRVASERLERDRTDG